MSWESSYPGRLRPSNEVSGLEGLEFEDVRSRFGLRESDVGAKQLPTSGRNNFRFSAMSKATNSCPRVPLKPSKESARFLRVPRGSNSFHKCYFLGAWSHHPDAET